MQYCVSTVPFRRLACIALAVFALTACGESPDSPDETTESAGSQAANEPALPTLVSLEPGDAACYVVLRDEGGEDQMRADFPICEMTQAIGKPVRIQTNEQSVMAASCEGDMECTDTETVVMITSMQIVQ